MSLHRAAKRFSNQPSSWPLQTITVLCYCCCLLAFIWVLINPDIAMKIFTVSAMFSVIVSGGNIQRLLANKRLLILPATILAFGLLQVIWVSIFKQVDSAYLGAYRSYQNAGKVMICTAFVITALSIRPPTCPAISKIINYFISLLALVLYGWCCYQYYNASHIDIENYRVSLNSQLATGTAYTLTLVALLASQALLNWRKKIVIPLYFIHFALSYFAIILTQTRAAILVYPVLSIGLFLLYYRHDRRILLYAAMTFLMLGLLALLPLKSILDKRYDDFKTDMRAYNSENSNTSIGSRFAMQHAGLLTGANQPLGQSLEQRNAMISAAAQVDPSLNGAVVYMGTHLHNELIDTFSLKGVLGVILLLGFYIAAGYTAVTQKNIGLLIVTGAIAIYGLSDLLLYAKTTALTSMLALCLAIMLTPRAVRESVHE